MKVASSFQVEFERETDGRWIAEIPQFPGALAYGHTKQEVEQRVSALALRIIADLVEHSERPVSDFVNYGLASR